MSSALPSMVIRVGVTGHRPNRIRRNAASLARDVEQVLALVYGAAEKARLAQVNDYAATPTLRRFTSGLAPGADLVAADAAHAAGWTLQSVLAFERGDFLRRAIGDNPGIDAGAFRTTFTRLCDASQSVLELDGPAIGGLRRDAYELVGDVTLEQSDVVVAIWDGQPARGLGGTAHLVRLARERGLPLVWIHATDAVQPKAYLPGCTAAVPLAELANWLFDSLGLSPVAAAPHGGHDDRDARRRWRDFVEERVDGAVWFPPFFHWLLKLGGKRWPVWPLRKDHCDAGSNKEWTAFREAVGNVDRKNLAGAVTQSLREPFERADYLAEGYGRSYRGAYVLVYLLAGLATFVGLSSLIWNIDKLAVVITELAVILCAGAVAAIGRRWHWHNRWLEYRAVAELLRQARLGVWCGQSIEPNEGDTAHAAESWVGWYVRARVRELPLIDTRSAIPTSPTESTTPATNAARMLPRLAVASVLRDEICQQLKFNQETADVHKCVHERLETVERSLFVMIVVFCALFIVLARAVYGGGLCNAFDETFYVKTGKCMTFVGALIPAFGAVLLGLRSQGDFIANAERTAGTASRLEPARLRAEALLAQETPPDFQDLVELCDLCGTALADDVFAWRLVYRRKQLTPSA